MKTDQWGRKIWEPTVEPYRVLPHYRSSDALLYGWRDGKVMMFATEEDARACAAAIKGARRVYVHVAVNAETWSRNGRWKQVARY